MKPAINQVYRQVRDQAYGQIMDRVHDDQVYGQVLDEVYYKVRSQVPWHQVGRKVETKARSEP